MNHGLLPWCGNSRIDDLRLSAGSLRSRELGRWYPGLDLVTGVPDGDHLARVANVIQRIRRQLQFCKLA